MRHVLALVWLTAVDAPTRATAVAPQPPVLVSFELQPGGESVAPLHRVVGVQPSHYRVSQRADFAGATWQHYLPQPSWRGMPLSGGRCPGATSGLTLRLFLQVRAVLGQEVRVVDGQRTLIAVTAESNVLSDSTCVTATSG